MMQLVSAVRLEATKFMETTGTVYIIIIFFFPKCETGSLIKNKQTNKKANKVTYNIQKA